MEATTGKKLMHNRRSGADCVPRLGPSEAVAEIAAPHQNEEPHRARALRRLTYSANRSGARGATECQGKRSEQGRTGFRTRPAGTGDRSHSPRSAIVCQDALAVKASAKSGRNLDSHRALAENNPISDMGELELM